MNSNRNENVIDSRLLTATPWRMYILIVIVGLITTGIVSYGFYKGDRMNKVYAPLIDAAMEIKLETTTAHLWFEEIISGDRHEDIEVVWEHLNQADWYAKAILEGGRNPEGTFIPLDDAKMRQEIGEAQEKLMAFRDITKQRIDSKETSGIGTVIDQRYDAVFSDLLSQADEVETRLQQVMAKDLGRFRFTQLVLIVICFILFLSIGTAFWRFDRLRTMDFMSLNKMNEDLEKEMSERKQTEAALKESEARYRAMFENISNGVAVYKNVNSGEDFIFVDFNKAGEEMEKVKRGELIGKSVLDVFPGVKDFGLFEVFKRVWKTGKPEDHPISIYKDKRISGWRENYVYKLPSEEIVAVYSDETERMQAQEEREILIQELEVKNAELERFTYTVSHDLKSPLITIKGFVGMIEKDAESGNTERMIGDIARISDAAGKMQRLLDELLELSRIGRVANPSEEVLLGDLATEAVDAIAERLKESGIRVSVDHQLPVVYVDRLRFREVLDNLLNNAVKSLGEQSDPHIEIGKRNDDGERVFYVRDNGIGIDPRYHEKIFGLFDKLDQETEGTGIGLAIVKRIIEIHGGRIWVESEGSGKGTTFCFTLPDKPEQ